MRSIPGLTLTTLAATLLLAGCSSAKSYTDSYGLRTYTSPLVEDVETVAVLPVSFTEDNTGYERLAADLLADVVSQQGVGWVVRVEDVISEFNKAGIADDYANLLTVYRSTGILDQPTLERMTAATGAGNFLYSTFDYEESKTADGVTRVLVINAENWDMRLGDLSTEGRGVSRDFVSSDDLRDGKRDLTDFTEMIVLAAEEVAKLFY